MEKVNNTPKVFNGNLTEAQVDAFKAHHRKSFAVEIQDGFAKGCTLIRANLHVEIDKIETEEEWAQLYCEAIWLERWRNRNRAELIASLFSDSGAASR